MNLGSNLQPATTALCATTTTDEAVDAGLERESHSKVHPPYEYSCRCASRSISERGVLEIIYVDVAKSLFSEVESLKQPTQAFVAWPDASCLSVVATTWVSASEVARRWTSLLIWSRSSGTAVLSQRLAFRTGPTA